ncbi:MAG: glycine--tRNA ligase [Candidatus Portnoybacteria bacterium]|nr:glycine--tRNA ligase [Candidatus Portnoybacteria bacterium]
MLYMDKIVSLCKRRGFIFPGSEIYGGLANTWDYGPLGAELKDNIKQFWWRRFVQERGDVARIDTAIIMNPKVWEASGHLKEFKDSLVECRACHQRFRPDEIGGLPDKLVAGMWTLPSCPNCGLNEWTSAAQFNLMFKTFFGPVEDEKSVVYLRPETAQGMFVNFKNVLDTVRKPLPFGIAQIGKAFRNEITPGNFIFRTREFEMMEIEYFVREQEWEKWFSHWQEEMKKWIADIGIDTKKVHEAEIGEGERAHYSKRTIDFEYEWPFGQKELYGLAYRGDFDLKNHQSASGQSLLYRDPVSGEEFLPHVIEPTWGVDRTFLAVLLDAYHEEGERVVLKLKPFLAPIKVAVFPLLANKPQLVELARKMYDTLRKKTLAAFDDRGNIGKRYYTQDEIGTPWCVTVDFQSLEDETVTVRDRDTMKQIRMSIKEVEGLKFMENVVY